MSQESEDIDSVIRNKFDVLREQVRPMPNAAELLRAIDELEVAMRKGCKSDAIAS